MVLATRRVVAKDPYEKLAERLGNVTEAYRRGGIDQTSFYDWKKVSDPRPGGAEGDLPPIATGHPMTTPPEVVVRIKELALKLPAIDPCCKACAAMIRQQTDHLSPVIFRSGDLNGQAGPRVLRHRATLL